MYYVKIEANGKISQVEIDSSNMSNKLTGYYKEIGCDMVEIVHARYLPEPYCIICDEEFLLKDEPKLNAIASLMYGTQEHGHPICGTVLIGKDKYVEDGLETVGYDETEVGLVNSIIAGTLVPMHVNTNLRR